MPKTPAKGKPASAARSDPRHARLGQQIRLARLSRDMSQQTMSEHLRVTFQQIQKYECGTNRISAMALWDVAQLLGHPVTFFFDGLIAPSEGTPNPLPGCFQDKTLLRDLQSLHHMKTRHPEAYHALHRFLRHVMVERPW